MSTPFHAKYFAYELMRQRPAAGLDRLTMSLFDACVDLNPHQIDAALFSLQSPLSKGVILADEVGLGKTIEAGLVLCQYWAERKRRLLVLSPASLRKQWSLELEEKFNLPTVILDAKTYRQIEKSGNPAPFMAQGVVILSLNYASRRSDEIKAIPWDMVVIDEAHKLRNAYRPSNKMGRRLRWTLEDRRKLLLTATPLQNSLLELYGLSTFIDPDLFGDASSFRTKYMGRDGDLDELRTRLQSFCKRTLRNQVTEYIQYTERRTITQPFRPTDDEHKLYIALSAFFDRENTFSVPKRQRNLTAIILRKLLASSSHAIAGTLDTMKERLVALRKGLPQQDTIAETLIAEEELEDELLDLSEDDILELEEEDAPKEPKFDHKALDAEIKELKRYAAWARSIGIDTKSRELLKALEIGFAKMQEMGASKKSLIFTESRRTQNYLRDFLEANGYAGRIVLFNGANTAVDTGELYKQWLETNRDTGRISGSRSVDIRTAVIDHFCNHADIMIATEAAAEGVNLQFCSMVINYDLPWNPQRVEQRIGRCHRYGQKYDVVVINFLNQRNEADRRVLQLLTEKFHLFSGVFGSSDDVLGSIESGIDFEKRILNIYQTCRLPLEIEAAFRKLQEEMDESITAGMSEARRTLVEHFDEDVHARLRVQLDQSREQLDMIGKFFWTVTKYILREHASFDDKGLTFNLHTRPTDVFDKGIYHLISQSNENVPGDFLYRLSHPLGEYVIEKARGLDTPVAHVEFNITDHPTRIASVESLQGRSGWILLQRLRIKSFEPEEYILFSALDDAGQSVAPETCEKLFRCHAMLHNAAPQLPSLAVKLAADARRHSDAMIVQSLETNNVHFQRERERLDQWADDMVLAAEMELTDIKAQIRAKERESRQATTTDEQYRMQTEIRYLENRKRRKRQRIFDVEDDIRDKRDTLIEKLESRLSQETATEPLFTIRWSVV